MQPKSKLAAGLFALLLGQFGVHNFYMGYTSKAVWQLVLTIIGIVSSVAYIGLAAVIAVSVWTLIEGILILSNPNYCDARGVRLEWNPQ